MTRPDITAVLLGSVQGTLIGASLRSLLDAAQAARSAGLTVELLAVLDRPDPATREALSEAAAHGVAVTQIDAGDAGEAHNHAVRAATGGTIAVLDGGDLWSDNWLVEAHRLVGSDPDGRVVAHPEVSWLFGVDAEIYFSADQLDPAFDPGILRYENPWGPCCLAPVLMYVDHPAGRRTTDDEALADGWRLNRETYAAGYVHRVAPDTAHFRRLPDGSPELDRGTSYFLGSGWWGRA